MIKCDIFIQLCIINSILYSLPSKACYVNHKEVNSINAPAKVSAIMKHEHCKLPLQCLCYPALLNATRTMYNHCMPLILNFISPKQNKSIPFHFTLICPHSSPKYKSIPTFPFHD